MESRWLAIRSSSACKDRTSKALGAGTRPPRRADAMASMAWQKARAWATDATPSARSAKSTPSSGAQALEAAFQAAVLVVNAGTHMRDVLAGSFHEVLDRLEYAGAHRAVRDGEDAFARDVRGQVRLVGVTAGGARRAWAGRRRLRAAGQDQWVDATVAFGDEPEHVR